MEHHARILPYARSLVVARLSDGMPIHERVRKTFFGDHPVFIPALNSHSRASNSGPHGLESPHLAVHRTLSAARTWFKASKSSQLTNYQPLCPTRSEMAHEMLAESSL